MSTKQKKGTNQNVQNQENIVELNLNNLVVSSNPRTHFDEEKLNELANSIEVHGVIQPITVRPKGKGKYEIVCGERRFRGSQIAGKTTIPSIIKKLSDDEAEELALTENIQRENLTPFEEAHALKKLMDSGRYDKTSLALQFGKSESYIYNRLKLTNLIPEIGELCNQKLISLSLSQEISQYTVDIQEDIFENHLKNENWSSWRKYDLGTFRNEFFRNYTTNLNSYNFCKNQCKSCPSNTNYVTLFPDANSDGNCTNFGCLTQKNNNFIVEKVKEELSVNPELVICISRYSYSKEVVSTLEADGYEISDEIGDYFPEAPEKPNKEDWEEDEQDYYMEAMDNYEDEMKEYQEEIDSIYDEEKQGLIKRCIIIESSRVEIGYIIIQTDSENNNDATLPNDKNKAEYIINNEIQKIEKKYKRNLELQNEKIVTDVKRLLNESPLEYKEFCEDEDKMLYRFMISKVSKKHFPLLGITREAHYLNNDEIDYIINENLTQQTKDIIARDYIVKNFLESYGTTFNELLLLFSETHLPEQTKLIEENHTQAYTKRNNRLDERKAILQAKLLIIKKQQEEAENSVIEQPRETEILEVA